MFKRWITLLATACLPALAGAAPLCVAVSEVSSFGQRGPDGGVSGISAALVQLLRQHSGLALQPRLVPVARAMHEVDSGACDLTLLLPVPHGPGTRVLGDIGQLEVIAVPRRGLVPPADGRWTGLRVVSLIGGVAWGERTPLDGARRVPVASLSAMFRMLKAERADVAIGARQSLSQEMSRNGLQPDDFGTPISLGWQPLQLFAGPGVSAADAARLQEALREIAAAREAEAVLAPPRR